jgi:hypothetical protein
MKPCGDPFHRSSLNRKETAMATKSSKKQQGVDIGEAVYRIKRKIYTAQSCCKGAFVDTFACEANTGHIPSDSTYNRVGNADMLEIANKLLNEAHVLLENLESDVRKGAAS